MEQQQSTSKPVINGEGSHTNGYNDSHTGEQFAGARPVSDLVAICGMAMRLPGGINDEESFWNIMLNGQDMRIPIPADRYNAGAFGGAIGKKGAIQTVHGYFLEDDLAHFDASFFSMTRSDVEKADPQQRMALEVVRECFESAGEIDFGGKDVGCYVGTFGEDWLHSQSKENQSTGSFSGSGDLMLANRVSFEFDLKGPSLVIKTGCSASLVALHHACRAIQSGDCVSAVVVGTSLIMGPHLTAAMTQQGVLSPEGSCKPFDAAADGFARAESINAVYVKRLGDAIRDGNPIRAVIRGIASNSDGRSASLMAPNGAVHEALMRKIYADTRLDPSRTGYVECHGTGTPTGDPIEVNAIGSVFGDQGVIIGSVKANIGHAEGASGINSLIKAVLCLERQTVPPQIKFKTPNSSIRFAEKKLVVPTEPTTWPRGRARRVSVNSFGIGGTNAHVIVDSPSEVIPVSDIPLNEALERAELMLLSANTPESLKAQIAHFEQYLSSSKQSRRDISYTLAKRRQHLPHRAFVVTGTQCQEASRPTKVPSEERTVTLVFSGQGAQWPRMAADLLEHDARFREDIRTLDEVLQRLSHPPRWSIETELLASPATSQVARAEYAQPLTTAVQIALSNVLIRAGVRFSAVVGHSSGEIAAAYASGSLSMDEAIILAYYRGFVTKGHVKAGGMAAIGLGADTVKQFLIDDVVVACENSSQSVTISGDAEALLIVMDSVKHRYPEVFVRKLKVDMAYHSTHMLPLSHQYGCLVQAETGHGGLKRNKPRAVLYSSVLDETFDPSDRLDSEYWCRNLTGTVRFHSAVRRLLRDQAHSLLIEVGPHSTLAGPLRQICEETDKPFEYVPTMLRHQNSVESLLSAYGQMFQLGVGLDLDKIIPTGRVVCDLPAYAWDHSTKFWAESRVSKDWRFRSHGHHALLGQRIPETAASSPSWRVVLDLEDEPWLADHKVLEDIVFPFAAYVAMAGEAIRQITDVETGYSVRHIVASTALVLSNFKPVELVTSLSRHKWTDNNESDAYYFTVSSWSGNVWITHCEGLVKPLVTDIVGSVGPSVLPRETSADRWYEAMARIGLNYGPTFRRISSVASSAVEQIAGGTISVTQEHLDAPFAFHPAAMDSALQMILAAQAQVAGRNLTQLAVPTLVEELDVSHMGPELKTHAWARDAWKSAGVECTSEGKVVLRLHGAQLTPLENERSSTSSSSALSSDPHAGARLEWYPDFDFVNVVPLLEPPVVEDSVKRNLEKLTLLCLLDSCERTQNLSAAADKPHFDKFRAWLQREKVRAARDEHPCIENASAYLRYSAQQREVEIGELMASFATGGSFGRVAEGILRIRDNAEGLFAGEVDTLELLLRDNVLAEIYNAISFGFGNFVSALAVNKPNLRILEVGAGTGGTTEPILRTLLRRGENPQYSVYTFTDISAGFFAQAQERFSFAPNMEYKTLDISRDPTDQGFEPETYDLILAPNVVHATPNLNKTLKVLRQLLKPRGHLVLTEVCAVARAPAYVFGNFSGWWLGGDDDREWEPYVQVDRWDRELRTAGFTGVDAANYDDDEESWRYCVAMVSQAKPAKVAGPVSKPIALLCGDRDLEVNRALKDGLEKHGHAVDFMNLGDDLATDRNLICTLDLESPFFENIGELDFGHFQRLLRQCSTQTILWLLPPSQLCCDDPRSAQTIGAFRVARAELAIPLHTLEIRAEEERFCDLVVSVYDKVSSTQDDDSLLPDREFAVQDGVIKIGRYQPFNVREEIVVGSVVKDGGMAKTLEVGQPGLVDSLRWVEVSPLDRLGPHDVEIETRAIGLNFRDVMVAMGVLKFETSTSVSPLGIEASGVVTRIGSSVRNVAVGQRVCALAADGCFSTLPVFLDTLVMPIPEGLSFEQAASMPAVFTTVVQALAEAGQLSAGQTILIHSAAGGIGHAAIEVARALGARIFCTVGSQEKREYLVREMGIPDDHIFDSRNCSFLPKLMEATHGVGADLVVNSLSGEMLHTSWKCVAEFGKLIELGKRDLVGFGKLDMNPFLANRSYVCIDLAHTSRKRPETVRALMSKWLEMWANGLIKPIRSITKFDVESLEQGFRCLQKGDHIGKVVITFPHDITQIRSIPRANKLVLRPDASYLLTGGFGGIGRSVASWLVQHGARSLVFLSPRAGQAQGDPAFIAELESQGCDVVLVKGRADDPVAIQSCLTQALKPIKGVIHLAMRLNDGPIVDLTYEQWNSAIAPKVDGAWNIHHAFKDLTSLDFFVMTSSLVSLVDQPGQANYASGNTFLESFCQFRHNQGLPASVVGICPIDDIGFVSDNPQLRRRLKSQGLFFLPERELLDFVELAVLNSKPNPDAENSGDAAVTWKFEPFTIMGLRSEGHLDDPTCQVPWRRDRRMGTYHNGLHEPNDDTKDDGSSAADALKSFLLRSKDYPDLLTGEDGAVFLARQIGICIHRFMMQPIDEVNTNQTLSQIGLDSLTAIELRRWWKQALGLDISVLEIMNSGTLLGLGRFAAEKLSVKFGLNREEGA